MCKYIEKKKQKFLSKKRTGVEKRKKIKFLKTITKVLDKTANK